MTEEAWSRTAEVVKQRRLVLGLTQREAAARSHMSAVTWRLVESGQPVRDLTLYAVDRALEWAPGSAVRVLQGLEPVVEARVPEPPATPQPVGLGLDAAADGLTAEEIEPVLAVVRAIKRAKGMPT